MSREKFTAVDFKAEMEREHGYAVDAVKKWQYQVDRNRELEQELRDLKLVMHDLMHEKLPWWLANIAMEERVLRLFVGLSRCSRDVIFNALCQGDSHLQNCTRAILLRAIDPEEHQRQVDASWDAAIAYNRTLQRVWGIYDAGIHPASNRYVGVDLGAQPGDDRSVVGFFNVRGQTIQAIESTFIPTEQNAIMDVANSIGSTPEEVVRAIIRTLATENDE